MIIILLHSNINLTNSNNNNNDNLCIQQTQSSNPAANRSPQLWNPAEWHWREDGSVLECHGVGTGLNLGRVRGQESAEFDLFRGTEVIEHRMKEQAYVPVGCQFY